MRTGTRSFIAALVLGGPWHVPEGARSTGENAVTVFTPEPDMALLGVASLAALAAIRWRR